MGMNESTQSDDSSKAEELNRGKIEALYQAFNNLNWDKQKILNKNEVILFLNSNSIKGKFNEDLCKNLLKFLDFEKSNSIKVEHFIQYYIRFDMSLQKYKEELKNKLLAIQNTLKDLENQCNKYKNEEFDSNGFCKEAKLTVEITGIDILAELPDINYVKVLIEIIYCKQTYQKFFDIIDDDQNEKKIFELKPQKKTDNFLIVLKCVSEKNEIIEIGKREFPLDQLETQDEYDAIICIPDKNNDNVEAATINIKIAFIRSNYQFFLGKKKETELKIEQIKKDLSENDRFCKEINNIYLKNMKIQQQPNSSNIISNYKNIKPSTDTSKAKNIDINNNKENNQSKKQNLLGIKSNEITDKNIIQKYEAAKKKIQQLTLENNNLNEKIKHLQFQLNSKNNKSNVINNDSNEMVRLYKKIEELTEKLNRYPFILEKNERMLTVVFISISQNVNYPMICKNTDSIHKLEEELYKEYPNLGESDNYFLCKGMVINKFKKFEELNIKNGDAILINQREI